MQVEATAVIEKLKMKLADAYATIALLEAQVDVLVAEIAGKESDSDKLTSGEANS